MPLHPQYQTNLTERVLVSISLNSTEACSAPRWSQSKVDGSGPLFPNEPN
jgi:hypothetical protein